jgi:hypothetical protein
VVALVVAGKWLFRQRSPEEIIAAQERLRQLRGKKR